MIVLDFYSKEFRFGLHADSIVLVDFLHVLGSIEGHRALKNLFRNYALSSQASLLQIPTKLGLNPLTDSKVRKAFKHINMSLAYRPSHFTSHDLRRSGATYAFKAHVPIQDIKRHGTWSSDCVWQYIQSDHASGKSLANALAQPINAM